MTFRPAANRGGEPSTTSAAQADAARRALALPEPWLRTPRSHRRAARTAAPANSLARACAGRRSKSSSVGDAQPANASSRLRRPALRNKTYPLRVILAALTLYHLGYSLRETAAKLKSRFGVSAAPSSIANWIKEHQSLLTYGRLRAEGRRSFTPTQIIRAIKLYHRQVYRFAYHRAKLDALRADRSTSDWHRSPTSSSACRPHARTSSSPTARAPRSCRPTSFDLDRLVVVEKQNFATDAAALVLPTVGDNRLRHDALQRFFLANNSVTLAVEVPIWLTRRTSRQSKAARHLPACRRRRRHAITGHIDFLQVRNGAVHILDYKPDARTNRPIAQLTIYALAIARLTGVRLFDIKCAWFNEEQYCEFFPRALLARSRCATKSPPLQPPYS